MGPLVRPQGPDWHGLVQGIIDENTYLQTSQMIFRREYVVKIGGWNPKIALCQDVELSLRALLNRPKVAILPPSSYCVYHQDDFAFRISNAPSDRYLVSHADIYCDLTNLVARCGDGRVCRKFGEHLYAFARQLTAIHEYDRAKACLICARRLGIKRHIGSARHIILTYIFGFFFKHQILEALKSAASRLRTTGRYWLRYFSF